MSNGWGSGVGTQNAILTSISFLSDGTHESGIAHLDLATRIYWWIRTQILSGVTDQSLKIYNLAPSTVLNGVEVGGSHGSTDVINALSSTILKMTQE